MPKKFKCPKKNTKLMKSRPKLESRKRKSKEQNLERANSNKKLEMEKMEPCFSTDVINQMEQLFDDNECPFCFKKFVNEARLESHVASHSAYARTTSWYSRCLSYMEDSEETIKQKIHQTVIIYLSKPPADSIDFNAFVEIFNLTI